ncbi:recombinase family protein [Herbiconiux sp. VKM Ac-2851]|uniref:recombinase family protein n=1 Tax=Herbiconiux sp. VKM Ac-2851 TaxID=2739025 RepID=UPI001563E231|nr:recombinase family protein [Herbiconiux sp. VKM Ac-2851]NQX33584.1 recombinase family protein [Herbiconiux sp. VKM Ac-2851]
MTNQAAIYCRISLEDEAVPKVETQEAACRVLADEHKLTVADKHVYVDNGIPATGKTIREGTRSKRPDFNALLLAAEKGEFSTIIVVAGDRLARNYPDGLDIVSACVDGDVTLLTADEGAIDPRTPVGEDQAMNLFTGGRKEIRKRSLAQRRRYVGERLEGMPLWGRRPFGWDFEETKSPKNGKTSKRPMILNEKEAAAIRWAVEYFPKNGSTIYGVIKEWNEEFKVKSTAAGYARKTPVAGNLKFTGDWTNASVRSILRNPRIAGLVAVGGVVQVDAEGNPLKGKWPPIVTPKEWQDVVDKLDDPSRRTNAGRKPHSLGSGLVLCVCGLPLRATTIKGKPLGEPDSPPVKLAGLRCDVNRNQAPSRVAVKQHVSMRSDVLDPMLRAEVARAFLFGPTKMTPTDAIDLSELEAEAKELREAEDNASDVALLGGASATKAKKLILEIHKRLDEIEAIRVDAVSKSAHAAMAVDARTKMFGKGKRVGFKEAGKALTALKEKFDELPLHQRRELVKSLLYVEVMPGQGVKVDPERRVIILHRVVRTLNTDEQNEYLASLGF